MGWLVEKIYGVILAIVILGLTAFPIYAEVDGSEDPEATGVDISTRNSAVLEYSNEDIVAVLSLLVGDFPYRETIRKYIPGPDSVAPEDVPYTGLVIVAEDMGFVRAMSPKILDSKERIIYGLIDVDADTAKMTGIASYAETLDEALQSERAGDSPLVINALEAKGECPCNIVISDDDVVLILLANTYYHFLERLKVVIVD